MSSEELPIAENYNRKLTFPKVEWLTTQEVTNFINHLEPCLNNRKIFIGKNDRQNANDKPDVFLGSVNLMEKTLKYVNGKKIIETADCKVLSLEHKNSYSWKRSFSNEIPNYAYRACLNHHLYEYFYIGRTISTADADADDLLVGYVCRSDCLLYACNKYMLMILRILLYILPSYLNLIVKIFKLKI